MANQENKEIVKFCPILNKPCIKSGCAWWLKIQGACAIQVSARGFKD